MSCYSGTNCGFLLHQPSVNSERRLAHRHGRRALKASLTLGVLLGLFFSAWLPFFITNMAQVRRGTLWSVREVARYRIREAGGRRSVFAGVLLSHISAKTSKKKKSSDFPFKNCSPISYICDSFFLSQMNRCDGRENSVKYMQTTDRKKEKQHLDTALFLCWPAMTSQHLPKPSSGEIDFVCVHLTHSKFRENKPKAPFIAWLVFSFFFKLNL